MENKTGVILMTYGSATTSKNVAAYMEHIYRGKASPEIIADFENRYRLVGGSPLIAITQKQAKLLQDLLNKNGDGKYLVQAGMLHSAPFIDEAVLALKNAGVDRLKGIILSPQFSSFIMDGYTAALMEAAEKHGFSKDAVSVAEPWPTEKHFIKLLAGRVRASLQKLEKEYGSTIPVLFTTHSLPKRVVEKDPSYLKQLQATIDAVVSELGNPQMEWHACYQSAGHTPEEWLKPDLTDILDLLRSPSPIAHSPLPHAVLIAPIQFLADHLEILYDLDIAAKAQCDERNIAYHRIELPNADPLFIESLAAIMKE